MKILVLLTIIVMCRVTHGDEACSRIAIINQQEILVDPSTTRKGEGLRFHLEKDQVAKDYLKRYQDVGENKWRPATLGTIGTGLILGAFIANTSNNNRKAMIIGGTSTLLINFLITKTIESANESLLLKSIQEYNKRHEPKIYIKSKDDKAVLPSLYLQKNWSF